MTDIQGVNPASHEPSPSGLGPSGDYRAQLLALADRCEVVIGGDRALDGLIYVALNPDEQRIIGHEPGRFPQKPIYGPLTSFIDWLNGENGDDIAEVLTPPRYTTSFESAMTLAPDGMRLMLSEWDDEIHLRPSGPWQAIFTKPGCNTSFAAMSGYRCDHAQSPARAICAAALRARAAQ